MKLQIGFAKAMALLLTATLLRTTEARGECIENNNPAMIERKI